MPGERSSSIFHVTPAASWRALAPGEPYRAASLATEGFIHASTAAQLPFVLAKFFRGKRDLLRLEIDPSRLGCELRWVESEPGQVFPHVHGPIPREAVVAVAPIEAPA